MRNGRAFQQYQQNCNRKIWDIVARKQGKICRNDYHKDKLFKVRNSPHNAFSERFVLM